MKDFTLLAPRTLPEAIALLPSGRGREVALLAGGQDLLTEMKEHLVEPARVQRDRKQLAARRVGLDVEREHARLDLDARRLEGRVVEQPRDAGAPCCLAGDFAAALDAALDEVTRREPNVGLERVDARGVEPVAERRHVGGCRNLDARDGGALERRAVGRFGMCAERC